MPVEISEDAFRDENHWRVDLRGEIDGEEVTRSYHLAAETKTAARMGTLTKWGGEFDEIPIVTRAEKYRSWRAYESTAEGRM